MKKQLFYGMLLGAGMLTACTSDVLDLEQSSVANNDWASARPKIDVKFTAPETRFVNNGLSVGYETTDEVGAVLVDFDYSNPTSYWSIKDTHVGNNKFVMRNGVFTTDGTMVKGTWVMYSPYSKDMTTSRDGIKFTPKIVQKWADDASEIAKIDFRVSPACELDGSEANTFQGAIDLQSVYAYTHIQLEFNEAVKVQKLVVKPSTPFAKTYKIKNTNFASITSSSGNNGVVTADSKNTYYGAPSWTTRMERAQKAMRLQETYSASTFVTTSANLPLVKDGSEEQDIWALDCANNTKIANTFSGWMALPEGAYSQIDVYAYTSKGVYKYTVNNDHKATTNASEPTTSMLYLRGNHQVELGRVNSNCLAATKNDLVIPKTLGVAKTNAELQTATETNGTVVISQEDLIDVINGINSSNVAEIRVLGDNVKITKEVMTALNNKQNSISSAQLRFKDSVIEIVGDDSEYEIHDLIFNEGCKLVSGNIKVGNNVNVAAGKKFVINSGTKATIVKNGECSNSSQQPNAYQTIENKGTLVVNSGNTTTTIALPVVNNDGTINIDSKATIDKLNNNAGAYMVINGENSELTVKDKSTNAAIITNNNKLSIVGTGAFVNNSTITNNGSMTISAPVTNNGTITNNADKTILVKTTNGNAGTLNNNGTIDNSGYMYCHEGDNKINNLKTINAKANSTTYITTNSSDDESTTAINATGMIVGTINLDNRNEDVSVTNNTQKGYIKWVAPAGTDLSAKAGDKFNYVQLANGAETVVPNGSYAKYIEVNGGSIELRGNKYGSIKFNAAATLYANPASKVQVGSLTIAQYVVVKIPTENALGVYSLTQGNTYFTSRVDAEIKNYGTLLVGGNFWTSLNLPGTGTFASGDGGSTAFHWGEATW